MLLCKCGCGKELNIKKQHYIQNSFCVGHQNKGKIQNLTTIKKRVLKYIGKPRSEETKRKISDANKNRIYSTETIEKMSIAAKKRCEDNNYKEKISTTLKNTYRMGYESPMKGRHHSEESRKKISLNLKKYFKDNPDSLKKHSIIMKNLFKNDINHIRKVLKYSNKEPNISEMKIFKLLQQHYHDEWKYTGNGGIVINGKCPDFINANGKKQIIELFGEKWHKKEDEEIRKNVFKEYGFNTLIIWYKELNYPLKVMNKIDNFIKNAV